MEETPHSTGRTSWRRFAIAVVPAMTGAAALVVLMANGALAGSLSVSGSNFKVSGDSLDGTGFVQYGDIDQRVNQRATGGVEPVAVSAIKKATIKNLCQSVVQSLPLIGDVSLQIHAGEGATPVTADNLFIDLVQLNGDATFNNIEIGVDASELSKGPEGAKGQQDVFAQQADSVHIDHLQQVAVHTNAGTFRLNGLRLSLSRGKHECF